MLRYWKTIAWGLLITVLLFLPTGPISSSSFLNIEHIDKVGHLCMFFGLQYILLFDTRWNAQLRKSQILGISLIIVLSYAVLTELLQGATTHRSAEVNDVWADGIGALLGILIYRLTYPFTNRFFRLNP